jgi:hypothetical protein
MNTYAPFKAALKAATVELTSTQAQQYYKDQLVKDLGTTLVWFVTLCVTETIRLGSLTRDWVETIERDATTSEVVGLLAPVREVTKDQHLLTGFKVAGLLTPAPEQTPSTLIDRMISVVDEVEASKPRPRNRRVGHTTTNIVFGIDGRTVKELRALAKEQGYKNTSKLTKRELLGLMA